MVGAGEPEEVRKLLESPAGRQLLAEVNRRAKGHTEEALRAFDDHLHRSREHDTLLDICASAFGPQSVLYEKTHFLFLSAEPLLEKEVKNFDLLIYNQEMKYAIFVECKSSISAPATVVSEILKSRDEVFTHLDYLQESLGVEIVQLEFVVCVPAEMVDRVVHELERREADAQPRDDDRFIRVWQVNKFSGQSIQLFTRIQGRPEQIHSRHRSPALTRELAGGVSVDEAEVLFKAYPSSHPLIVATAVLSAIMEGNRAQNVSLTEFHEDHVRGFLCSALRVPHYAQPGLGNLMADRLLREGSELGVLQHLGGQPGNWKITVPGKTMKTLVANIQKVWREAAAKRIAERRATEEAVGNFRRTQPSVLDFKK